MRILVITLLLAGYSLSAQDQWKNVYRESAWKDRDSWQHANELIAFLKIKEGSKVADIGCNEGYLTMKLAAVAGNSGIGYAVDVDEGKLGLLRNHLSDRKVTNVQVVKGDYDDPKLPAGQLDAVIILDTYHEMDDHDEILQKISVALKPGGRLVLCEPIADERRKLPRKEQEKKHELAIGFAVADLTKAGYTILYQKDPFLDRTAVKGDKMWVIQALKK